jgi:hypothetical protein
MTSDVWVTCDVYSRNLKVGNHCSIFLNAEEKPNIFIEVAGLRTFRIHNELEDFFVQMFDLKLQLILVNKQLDALFQCIYLFHFPTCFEQSSAHHQENQLYQYIIWYVSLCVGDWYDRHTGQSPTQSDTNQLMY